MLEEIIEKGNGNATVNKEREEEIDTSTKTIQLVFYTPDAEMEETKNYAETQGGISYNSTRSYYNWMNKINSTWTCPTLIVDTEKGFLDLVNEFGPPSGEEVGRTRREIRRTGGRIESKIRKDGWASSEWGSSYESGGCSCPGLAMCGSQPELRSPEDLSEGRYREDTIGDIGEALMSSKNYNLGGGGGNLRDNDQDFRWPDGFVQLVDSVVEWRSMDGKTKYFKPVCCHVELILAPDPKKPLDYYSYYIRQGDALKKVRNKKYASNVRNVYTILNVSVDGASYSKLIDYCESQVGVMQFNRTGLLLNHALPGFMKSFASNFYSNGRSYRADNAGYCSEFITKAFCVIGIFEDLNAPSVEAENHSDPAESETTTTTQIQEPFVGTVPVGAMALTDFLKEFEKYGKQLGAGDNNNNNKLVNDFMSKYSCSRALHENFDAKRRKLLVDPSSVSPNSLFLYLWMKEYLFRRGKGEGFPDYSLDLVYRGLTYGTLPERRRKVTNTDDTKR